MFVRVRQVMMDGKDVGALISSPARPSRPSLPRPAPWYLFVRFQVRTSAAAASFANDRARERARARAVTTTGRWDELERKSSFSDQTNYANLGAAVGGTDVPLPMELLISVCVCLLIKVRCLDIDDVGRLPSPRSFVRLLRAPGSLSRRTSGAPG